MDRRRWNTYKITGYSYQVGTDPRATGGVHLHQVKKGTEGWMHRIVDSNGRYTSAGSVDGIDASEGEALFEQAKEEA